MTDAIPEPPTLPPIAKEPISVVLLAQNAEAHVEDVLDRWRMQLEKLDRPYQLLLVDDFSTDRTAELATAYVARFPAVQFLRLEAPQGEGVALKTGLEAAQHPLVCYAPCDRQYQPNDLRQLLGQIDQTHLVSGYRRWQQAPHWLTRVGAAWRLVLRLVFSIPLTPLPGWLGWKNHLRALQARVLFGIRLRDVGCTFRLFRRSIFERIPIQSKGRFAHVEILAKANFLGAVMTEIPLQYQPPASGTGLRDSHWSRDFRLVFSHPRFSAPPQPVLPPIPELPPA